MNTASGAESRPARPARLTGVTGSSDPALADVLGNPSPGPKLVVLCGPSHVGKSTFAGRLGPAFTVVSTDQIRSRLGAGFRPFGAERGGLGDIRAGKAPGPEAAA